MSRFLGTKGPWAECARLQTPRSPGVRNYAGAHRAFLFWELNMDADDRLNGETIDLKPLVGLLHGLPSSIIERLTVDAIHEHRTLLEQAENLFNELPAEVKAGKEAGSNAHVAYLETTIRLHAQMSALTTLLHILGYTPKV